MAAGAAVLAGTFLLNGQRYYLSACLILLLAFAAMLLRLERRHVRAREMVILAIMTALAVTDARPFSVAAGQALRRSHHSRRSIARRGARLSGWSDDRLCLKLFLWTGPVDALSNVRLWAGWPSGGSYF